jgi:hypothetical protein
MCSSNWSLVPEGIVVVGATAVVVGAVSIMVVAQPESNEVIVSSAIAEIFFIV